MSQASVRELGWQPDMPDWRDLTLNSPNVAETFRDLTPLASRPSRVSWREFCTEVDHGLDVIPSSTRVCVDLLEYFERRAYGHPEPLSSHFVHRTAARLATTHAGNPLSLRLVWKSIVRFGAPALHVWPGVAPTVEPDRDPDAFAYLMARSFSNLIYIRLDARGQSTSATLDLLRSFLAAGFTFVFGFSQFSSIRGDGEIGFPTSFDYARGGHAVFATGYDDDHRIRSDRGCFQVRGHWQKDWGDQGYGWLPYSYVRKQLASDFWTVLNPPWLESGEFHRPIP